MKLRYPRDLRVKRINATECVELFEMKKFYAREFMCYAFHARLADTYDYQSVATSIRYEGMSMEIALKAEPFGGAQFMLPIVTQRGILPMSSMRFATPIKRNVDDKAIKQDNYFIMSYNEIVIDKSRAARETRCFDYATRTQYLSRDYCIPDCINTQTKRVLNKVAYNFFVEEWDTVNTPYAHVTYADINNNETVAILMERFEQVCLSKCLFYDCHEAYMLTRMIDRLVEDMQGVVFRVDVPKGPNFQIEFAVTLPFNEYLIYVLSCAGTWLGVSVIQMNPLLWAYDRWQRGGGGKMGAMGARVRHVPTAVRAMMPFRLRMVERELLRMDDAIRQLAKK